MVRWVGEGALNLQGSVHLHGLHSDTPDKLNSPWAEVGVLEQESIEMCRTGCSRIWEHIFYAIVVLLGGTSHAYASIQLTETLFEISY